MAGVRRHRRQQPDPFRLADDPDRVRRRWLSATFIPARGSRRARADDQLEHLLAPPARRSAQLRADPRLWWGGLVTSWFWLVGVVVMSLLLPLVKIRPRRHRASSSTSIPGDLLHRGRARLRSCRVAFAGRIVILPTLIGAVLLGAVRDRSRLDQPSIFVHGAAPLGIAGFFATAGRHSHRHRSCRPGHRRRLVRRADLRGGAGLGRKRPPRPRGRPPSTSSTPPSWWRAR